MAWRPSYILQGKEDIEDTNNTRYLPAIDSDIPEESILIYVNDFYLASKFKNVMLPDDTNLFILDENIGELFQQMSKALKSVSTWFKANELSILLSHF